MLGLHLILLQAFTMWIGVFGFGRPLVGGLKRFDFRSFSRANRPAKSQYPVKSQKNGVVKPTTDVRRLLIGPDTSTVELATYIKELGQAGSKTRLSTAISHADSHKLMSLDVLKAALLSLHATNSTNLGYDALQSYFRRGEPTQTSADLWAHPTTTSFIVRWFCRNGGMNSVRDILEMLGVELSKTSLSQQLIGEWEPSNDPEKQNKTMFYHAFLSDTLSHAMLGFATKHQFSKAQQCLTVLKNHDLHVSGDSAIGCLRIFLKKAMLASTVRLMTDLTNMGLLADSSSLQLASGAFCRNIEFVKGAVSMDTLPPARQSHPEVAFMGRSNVGKSSLINSLTMRKRLAYTSQMPGKTTEFNYFDISGQAGPNQESRSFCLVDLPGVGYAQRSKGQRSKWTELLQQFARERSTLRALVHLVDSRHGALDADEECFDLLDNLPPHMQYVVVFTKVDKLRGADSSLPVTPEVYESVQARLRAHCEDPSKVTILYTSAETHAGVLRLLSHLLNIVGPKTVDIA